MIIYHGNPSPETIGSARDAAPNHAHGAEWQPTKMSPHDWPYILDNGAFTAYKNNEPWDVDAFVCRLDEIETEMPRDPDFVVLPDVVTSPSETLKRSGRWAGLIDQLGYRTALACQDGTDAESMAGHAKRLGCSTLFVGGTRKWKRRRAEAFVEAAHDSGLGCHIARPGDLQWAKQTGCDSVDTTSIVRNQSWERLRALEEHVPLTQCGDLDG